MASLIMAVTVLPWVALTVPGWAAVQAMAVPVHTAAVPVAAEAMVAPVPTAVQAAAVPVVAAQAMAAPVLTVVVLAVAAAMVVDPAPTAVPVAAMAVQAAVLAVARAMAVMAAGARAPTSRTKFSSTRAARAALLLFQLVQPEASSHPIATSDRANLPRISCTRFNGLLVRLIRGKSYRRPQQMS